MSPEQVGAWSSIADVITTSAVLLILAVLFFRGDIISRKVYDELCKRSIDCTSRDVAEKVVDGVSERIEDRVRVQQEIEERLAAIAEDIKLSSAPSPGHTSRRRKK
jgi:hypothetical protein